MNPVRRELDRGSYVAHYGLLSPWSLWLLRQAPELLALTPSELQQGLKGARDGQVGGKVPLCPECLGAVPMVARPGGWACYHHDPPVRYRPDVEVARLRWAPGQPPALSLIGQDIDIAYRPDLGGYVIIEKEAP